MVWTFTGLDIYLVNVQTMRKIVQFLWPSQKSWTLPWVKNESQQNENQSRSICWLFFEKVGAIRSEIILLYLESISTYCTYWRPSGAESKKPLQFGYLSQAKKNILTKILKRKVRSSKKPCNFSFSISRWRSNGAFEGNSLTFLQSFI